MEESLIVLVTAPSAEVAGTLGRALVEEKLAACVNVVGPIRSIYRWEDKVQDEPEALMLVKTTRAAYERLEVRVRALHPYDCPEVVALPIERGSAQYLAWLVGSVA